MNSALVYILSLGSKASREGVKRKLNQVASLDGLSIETYPWDALTPVTIQLILANLEDQGLSFSSVNAYLSALKGVAKQSWRSGLIDGDTLARIQDIPNRRGLRLTVGQAVTSPVIEQLLQTCQADVNSIRGARDAAIIALGFYAGLRRSEIGTIKLQQLNLHTSQLSVIGKGNKERRIPVANSAMPYLHHWLRIRSEQVVSQHLKGIYLLGRVDGRPKGQMLNLDGLAGNAIRLILRNICLKSGVDFDSLPTPHDMRRTAITNWINRANPRIAQALAGHGQIQTTMNYARDDLTDQMRQAVD